MPRPCRPLLSQAVSKKPPSHSPWLILNWKSQPYAKLFKGNFTHLSQGNQL